MPGKRHLQKYNCNSLLKLLILTTQKKPGNSPALMLKWGVKLY